MIGLPIACAGYFYANRLIDANLDKRSSLEIRCFFIVWGLVFIYALLRQHRQAWLELLLVATALFAFLPIFNLLTGGAPLWTSMANDLWVIASFDLAMWVLAVLFAFSFIKVKNHRGLTPKKGKLAQETE